ncbi:hypothetical protein HZH68_005554 [Vespula germanica]|uniref:Uncharacterized protein n=1 Tax=Vespula germanica TaxID=30212 RepID=A0A834NDL0_VESGE|nr:hypothetical protein HZH68_005554 [Vespula germanica]
MKKKTKRIYALFGGQRFEKEHESFPLSWQPSAKDSIDRNSNGYGSKTRSSRGQTDRRRVPDDVSPKAVELSVE